MSPAPVGPQGPSAIGALLAGGSPGQGADAVRAQLETLAGQIRDLGQQVDAVAMDFPTAAQEVSQIKNLLKAIIVKAAQQAPMASASGQAVPTGATMAPSPG